MSVSQRILNGVNKAQSARVMLQGRPTEAQAKTARNLLKQARADLLEAISGANAAVSEARDRDRSDAADKAIVARSMEMRGRDWFAVAVEVSGV